MANILNIIARANSLRRETAIDSISPERAGGIMYDTLMYINQMQLQESNPLLISKIYASVAAMEADAAPVSDITGRALRAGQVVCIVTSDAESLDNGVIYRYNGTTGGVSSWTGVGKIGSSPYLEGYLYMGIAVLTPTPTDPGVPTQKVFYRAVEPGTYTNFGGIVVNSGEVVNLKFDGSAWSKEVTGEASAASVTELGQKVDEGFEVGAKRINIAEQGYVPFRIKSGEKIIVRVLKSPGSSTNLYANPVQSGTGQVLICGLGVNNIGFTYEATTDTNYLRFTGANMTNGASVEIIRANGLWADVYDNIKETRYQQPAYPCFVAIGEPHTDTGGITVIINDGVNPNYNVSVYASTYYRSFLYLKLKGFDDSKTWIINYFRKKDKGSSYEVGFCPFVNGTRDTDNAVRFVFTEQITNPNGVNVISADSGEHHLDAIIDYSLIPDTSTTALYDNIFCLSPECFRNYADEAEFESAKQDIISLQQNAVTDSDITVEVVSNNLADPAGILLNTIVGSTGSIQSNNDWDAYKLPVTPGQTYTFGGFSLGRTGYYAFYNGTTKISNESMTTSQVSAGVTVTAPANATHLYFDIKSGSSPANPYQYLQINYGSQLLDYDTFEKVITKINGVKVAGSGGDDPRVPQLVTDVTELQEDVQELQEGGAGIIVDLPVSDGTDIEAGYAYINSTTGAVIVKQ